MTTPVQITTHAADALARLLEQYKGKPLLAGLIGSFTAQAQDAENAIFAMLDARSVYAAIGAQLDGIGSIVGIARPAGLSDDIYRRLVLAKAFINASQTDVESIGLMYRQVLLAQTSFFQDLYPAAFMIMADGSLPDPSLVDLVQTFLADCAAAGVSADHFGFYDPTNPFELGDTNVPGSLTGANGLGDINNPAIGGLLGALYIP